MQQDWKLNLPSRGHRRPSLPWWFYPKAQRWFCCGYQSRLFLMAMPSSHSLCSPLNYKCSFCSFQDYIWEFICLGHLRTLLCHGCQLCLSLACPWSEPPYPVDQSNLCSPGEAAGSAQLCLRPKPHLRHWAWQLQPEDQLPQPSGCSQNSTDLQWTVLPKNKEG